MTLNPPIEPTGPGQPSMEPVQNGKPMACHQRFEWVDHSREGIAAQIHSVQMSAYAQEAKLLGAVYFPPLSRTTADIRSCTETFLAASDRGVVVGAISVRPDPQGEGTTIASLVVAPGHQRQGIGLSLLQQVLVRYGRGKVTVQTGVKNVPALDLYARSGFVERRRWWVGREPLELVELHRAPTVDSR